MELAVWEINHAMTQEIIIHSPRAIEHKGSKKILENILPPVHDETDEHIEVSIGIVLWHIRDQSYYCKEIACLGNIVSFVLSQSSCKIALQELEVGIELYTGVRMMAFTLEFLGIPSILLERGVPLKAQRNLAVSSQQAIAASNVSIGSWDM